MNSISVAATEKSFLWSKIAMEHLNFVWYVPWNMGVFYCYTRLLEGQLPHSPLQPQFAGAVLQRAEIYKVLTKTQIEKTTAITIVEKTNTTFSTSQLTHISIPLLSFLHSHFGSSKNEITKSIFTRLEYFFSRNNPITIVACRLPRLSQMWLAVFFEQHPLLAQYLWFNTQFSAIQTCAVVPAYCTLWKKTTWQGSNLQS